MKVLILMFSLCVAIDLAAQVKPAKSSSSAGDLHKQVLSLGVKHFQRIDDVPDAFWDLLYTEIRGENTLAVYSADEGNLLAKDTSDSDRFVSATAITVKKSAKPLLAAVWTQGVSSRELRIYDFTKKEKSLVFSQLLDRETTWDVENGVLIVKMKLDEKDSKTGLPKEKVTRWEGPKSP